MRIEVCRNVNNFPVSQVQICCNNIAYCNFSKIAIDWFPNIRKERVCTCDK